MNRGIRICAWIVASAALAAVGIAFGSERNGDGLTPLHLAAGRGDLAAVQKLVEHGADIFALDSRMGVSVLHKAVYSGNAEVVGYLLDHGAPIDLQSPSNGNTPLHDGIYFKGGNGLRVINVLLHHNPSLVIKNRAGLAPIESATLLKDKEVVEALKKHSESIYTATGRALMAVVAKDDSVRVKEILGTKNVNLDEADDQGFTPLIWAAREGYVEIVRLLLENGADPNRNDQWMRANAAHKAAFWGRADVMKLLVKSGMDLNARGGYNGYTPLHDAIAQSHADVVKVLLGAGVRTDIEGHDGKTARTLAQANGDPEILKLMKNAHGNTP